MTTGTVAIIKMTMMVMGNRSEYDGYMIVMMMIMMITTMMAMGNGGGYYNGGER